MRHAAHALADARSLALHRAVAERLEVEPAVIRRARERVEGWLETGEVPRPLAEAWLAALDGSVDGLRALLTDGGERAQRLRQASPFAGVLPARERWAILRKVGSP